MYLFFSIRQLWRSIEVLGLRNNESRLYININNRQSNKHITPTTNQNRSAALGLSAGELLNGEGDLIGFARYSGRRHVSTSMHREPSQSHLSTVFQTDQVDGRLIMKIV